MDTLIQVEIESLLLGIVLSLQKILWFGGVRSKTLYLAWVQKLSIELLRLVISIGLLSYWVVTHILIYPSCLLYIPLYLLLC